MIIGHSREKLINSIIYFYESTTYCGKIKLFKLLYFLDFLHYSETGRSVTGLDYYAWDKGPVPKDLHQEMKKGPKKDMAESLELDKVETSKGDMLKIIPKREFDPSHFTKRELRIMENLAHQYKDKQADDMIEATHLENQPWHEIYEVRKEKDSLIPYSYALKRQEKEEMKNYIREMEEFWKGYE